MMKPIQAPPQLSFDFGSPVIVQKSVAVDALRYAVPVVLDMSVALKKKQHMRTKELYERILDSVKHLG